MSYISLHTHKKGFTVVEALVAISILLMAITGAFSVAQSSLQSSSLAKNRTTAYFLAQEGIEYIRNLRDHNGIAALIERTSNISWLEGFGEDGDPCEVDVGTCYYDVLPDGQTVLNECVNGNCPNLFIDNETHLFQYGTQGPLGAYDSGFNRTIRLFSVPNNDNEIEVRVEVTWLQGSVQKSLLISENLFNWQQVQPFI